MIDMETLSTRTWDPVVLTLAAIRFDPFHDDRDKNDRKVEILYLRPDVDQQIAAGRHVDEDTVAWWGRQGEAALEEAMSIENRLNWLTSLNKLADFCRGVDAVWSHGSGFDCVILENAFKQNSMTTPWSFWQTRDTRTLFDLVDDVYLPQQGLHNAKYDAMRQILGVQDAVRKLGIKEFAHTKKKRTA